MKTNAQDLEKVFGFSEPGLRAAPSTEIPSPCALSSSAVQGVVLSPCRLWTGPINNSGYGLVYFEGKHTTAHRVAWIKARGKIPKGKIVCHHCDNPPCINPEHLFVGTHKDNSLDAQRKGRLGIKKYPQRFKKNYRGIVEAPRFSLLPRRWREEPGVIEALRNGAILFHLTRSGGWTYQELRDIIRRNNIIYIKKGDRPGSVKSLGKSYPETTYKFPRRINGKAMKLSRRPNTHKEER